jgi:hypothetical protein
MAFYSEGPPCGGSAYPSESFKQFKLAEVFRTIVQISEPSYEGTASKHRSQLQNFVDLLAECCTLGELPFKLVFGRGLMRVEKGFK